MGVLYSIHSKIQQPIAETNKACEEYDLYQGNYGRDDADDPHGEDEGGDALGYFSLTIITSVGLINYYLSSKHHNISRLTGG